MILSLLDDSQRDDTLNHNLAMLIYVFTHEDVLLVQSGDMHKLISKMYCFTPRFNKNQNEPSGYEWSDSSIIFTRRQNETYEGRAAVGNNSVAGGGPARTNNRVVARRVRHGYDQYSHSFDKDYKYQPAEEVVPLFRGVSQVPPNAQLFSSQALFEHYAEYKDHYSELCKKNRKERMRQEKIDHLDIKTPVPNPKHTTCMICNIVFREGEYKEHIRSSQHAQSVKAKEHFF